MTSPSSAARRIAIAWRCRSTTSTRCAAAETPSEALLARIEADALAALPAPRRAPLWPALRAALGGWPGIAGLAAASAVGLWIGIAQPSELDGLLGSQTALDALGVDPLSSYDLAWIEG